MPGRVEDSSRAKVPLRRRWKRGALLSLPIRFVNAAPFAGKKIT